MVLLLSDWSPVEALVVLLSDWSPVVVVVLVLSDWSPVVVVLSIVRLERPRRSIDGVKVEVDPVTDVFTSELEPLTVASTFALEPVTAGLELALVEVDEDAGALLVAELLLDVALPEDEPVVAPVVDALVGESGMQSM